MMEDKMMEDKTQMGNSTQGVGDKTQNPNLVALGAARDEASLSGLSQDQLVDLFIDELIKEKGIEVSELEKNRIAERLKDEVLTEILMRMPNYLVDKINDSLDNGTASDRLFDDAIEESGIDASKIAERTMLKFREDFLNDKLGEEA